MAVASGELWQMTLQMLLDGQICENVLNMRERTGASTPAEIRTSAQAFWTTYRGAICGGVTLNQIVLKQMTPIAFDEIFAAPIAGEENGAIGGAPAPNAMAVVVTLRTGTAGKSHRGRMYIPGVSTGQLTDNGNKVNPVSLPDLQTVFDNLVGIFGDAAGTDPTFAWGIYSKVIGGSSPYTVAGWQPVDNCVVRPILGNQRRRRIGVGI